MRSQCYYIVVCLLLLANCAGTGDRLSTQSTPLIKPIDTLVLVQQHCGRCHQVPKPEDLPLHTWNNYVLPRMGAFLGIYDSLHLRKDLIEEGAPSVEAQRIFPEKAQLSAAEWGAIQTFYQGLAPGSLSYTPLNLAPTQAIFQARFPDIRRRPPGTLLTQFTPPAGYFIGDVHQQELLYFDGQHKLRGIVPIPGGPVQLITTAKAHYALGIGSFSPTDRANGQLWQLPQRAGENSKLLIDKLQRPVHFNVAPHTAQQVYPDMLIAEYGKWTGQLAYWKANASGEYQATPLWERSGAISTAWADIDGDKQDEILVLFAQGQEGIWAFKPAEDGTFTAQSLIDFPPSYGSSSMQVFDWNQDGRLDIIYTNGDNADYPPVLKPYHGIRVFLNKGASKFEEALFLPLPGAYACAIADFDLDNDLDLVAISFFPDFAQQPQQALVLFEQTATGEYSPHPFAESERGRWIRLAAADADQDGDQDILVGAMAFEVVPDRGELDRWLQEGLGWLYFENKTR